MNSTDGKWTYCFNDLQVERCYNIIPFLSIRHWNTSLYFGRKHIHFVLRNWCVQLEHTFFGIVAVPWFLHISTIFILFICSGFWLSSYFLIIKLLINLSKVIESHYLRTGNGKIEGLKWRTISVLCVFLNMLSYGMVSRVALRDVVCVWVSTVLQRGQCATVLNMS